MANAGEVAEGSSNSAATTPRGKAPLNVTCSRSKIDAGTV
jgi:hypothetical protein